MVNQQFATALHIVSVLAYTQGELVSSQALAKSIHANPVTVRKFIGQLVEAQLVKTSRGPSGGAQLARGPETVSLGDVYLAVAPRPIIISREKKGDPECPVGCRMASIVNELSSDMEDQLLAYLHTLMLTDLLEKFM